LGVNRDDANPAVEVDVVEHESDAHRSGFGQTFYALPGLSISAITLFQTLGTSGLAIHARAPSRIAWPRAPAPCAAQAWPRRMRWICWLVLSVEERSPRGIGGGQPRVTASPPRGRRCCWNW